MFSARLPALLYFVNFSTFVSPPTVSASPLGQFTHCNFPPAPRGTSSVLFSRGTQYSTVGCPVSESNCFIILSSFLIFYKRKVFLILHNPPIDRIRIPGKFLLTPSENHGVLAPCGHHNKLPQT